jgi:hypothetical protein
VPSIVIRGYEGEPYLRFSPRGVFQNVRSPAAYLNRSRFPRGDAPASADPAAPPAMVAAPRAARTALDGGRRRSPPRGDARRAPCW